MEKILTEFKEHTKDFADILSIRPDNPDVLFIAAQGSMNYGLDYEGSDVDTTALFVPSYKSLARAKSPESWCHCRPNSEHINIKDYREYFKMLFRQSPQALELLFTPYIYINDLYKEPLDKLFSHREEIARMNMERQAMCVAGMSESMCRQMANREKAQDYKGAVKSAVQICRMENFLTKFTNPQVPYAECLTVEEMLGDYLKEAKRSGKLTVELADMAKTANENIQYMVDDFLGTYQPDPIGQDLLASLLYEVAEDILRISFKEELYN